MYRSQGRASGVQKRTGAARSACAKFPRTEPFAKGGHQSGARPTRRSVGAQECKSKHSQSRVCAKLLLAGDWAECRLTYRASDADKGEGDAGLPVLGRLEDEVVQRLTNLPAMSKESTKT
jgi:hypothetical protein